MDLGNSDVVRLQFVRCLLGQHSHLFLIVACGFDKVLKVIKVLWYFPVCIDEVRLLDLLGKLGDDGIALEKGRIFIGRHDIKRVVLFAKLLHSLQYGWLRHCRNEHRLLLVVFACLLVERKRVPLYRYSLLV